MVLTCISLKNSFASIYHHTNFFALCTIPLFRPIPSLGSPDLWAHPLFFFSISVNLFLEENGGEEARHAAALSRAGGRPAATGEACAAAGGLPRASGLPPNTPLRLLMLTALRHRGTVQADTLAEAKKFPQAPGDLYLAQTQKPVEVEISLPLIVAEFEE